MKKKILCITIICGLTASMFAGCGSSHEIINSDSFVSVLENEGYSIDVASEEDIANYADLISSYYVPDETYVAYDDEGNSFDFYLFADDGSATSFFNSEKELIESIKSNGSSSETNTNNYNKYSQTSGGYFQYIARIGNTIIDAMGTDENKSVIKNIIDELGY